MRRNFSVLCLTIFTAALLWSTQAWAFVAPLQTDGEHFYLHKTDRWQIAVANIKVVPRFDVTNPSKVLHSWTAEAELWLRNITVDKQSLILGVADSEEHTGETQVFLDGQRIDTAITNIEYEKSKTDIHQPKMRRFSVSAPHGGRVVLKIRMVVDAKRGDDGQYTLTLPTNLLSLLSKRVLHSFIHVELDTRPIGMTTTLGGHTFYDFPENKLSWFALDWKPTIPLQISWLESWALLSRIAEVEKCPAPWNVVRHVSSSDLKQLRDLLAAYDAQTLRFCSSLPLVLHGYVFSSARVRQQFSEVPLRRYLGKQARDGSLYRENPSFERDDLPQAEYLYWSTLAAAAKKLEN